MTPRLLVVTAVAAERDAVVRALSSRPSEHPLPGRRMALRTPTATVLAAGVGPAAAAAGTAAALASAPYDLVVSAGIAGGFEPVARIGSTLVADAIVAADLGAEGPEGFIPVAELGYGTSAHRPPPELSRRVAEALGAEYGPLLTVSTVTGSAERAAELIKRHPGAVGEAMEGFGVAEAATAHRVPVLEIRTVANPVGPRDRASWRVPDALDALTKAFTLLRKQPDLLDVGDPHE
ncbi:futalosine hydrolase [Streptomyces sp. NPDC088354]|uniref:futalosine hydrolase n=1 Tax=Streptomyces sp. NPDC088354 TaxID=3365856 RepID=UPI0037F8E203